MASKDAHYIRHDYNASSDPKLINVRRDHGTAGYGTYWLLVEWLRQQKDGRVKLENVTAFIFNSQTDKTITEAIINDYELFTIDNGYVFNERLNRDTESYNAMKTKQIEGGRKGGKTTAQGWLEGKLKVPLKPTLSSKEENRIEKKSKEEVKDMCVSSDKDAGKTEEQIEHDEMIDKGFEIIWGIYPARNGKKLDKAKVKKLFLSIPEKHYYDIEQAVNNYANDTDIKKGIGIRDPIRFLRNDYYREYLTPTTATTNQQPTHEEKVAYWSDRARQDRYSYEILEGNIEYTRDGTETWIRNSELNGIPVTDEYRAIIKKRREERERHAF
jgi:hypothetical protein